MNNNAIRVSYAKASVVITTFSFIFITLLETMFVYRISRLEEAKKGKVSLGK